MPPSNNWPLIVKPLSKRRLPYPMEIFGLDLLPSLRVDGPATTAA